MSNTNRISKEDLYYSVLEALDSIKPLSRKREALMYFILGFGGGIGLGVLIWVLKFL